MINTQGIASCYKEVTNRILGVVWTQNVWQIRYTLKNQGFYRSGEIWDRPKKVGKKEHSMENVVLGTNAEK